MKQPRHTFDPDHYSYANSLTAQERMSRVFGSVGTREDSRKEAERRARIIAGVKLPERPEQPTNCCMSGCINCVWDMYKDELQEWKEKRKDAKLALLKRPDIPWPEDFGPEPDRRSGQLSQQEKLVREQESQNEWEGIDIAIRVFVETERRLRKQKEQREANLAKAANAAAKPT